MNMQASIDRDANRVPIQGNQAIRTKKAVTFDGTASKGAQGTVPLFTVTGLIYAQLVVRCTQDLAGATATIKAGTTNNTGALIGAETATDLDNGVVVTADAGHKTEVALGLNEYIVTGNILATIATADITAGKLEFYLLWRPLSDDANVVAA